MSHRFGLTVKDGRVRFAKVEPKVAPAPEPERVVRHRFVRRPEQQPKA